MKLLNREPTEGMLAATGAQNLATAVWQLMYDAAPEIKIDMQPVAWTALEDKTGMILLYSAEQVATLQADIERLTAERDALLEICKEGYDFMGACGMEDSIFAEHAQEAIAKYEGKKHG